MDNRRFDQLTRLIGQGVSRRTILKGLLGLGGATIAGAGMGGSVEARVRRTRPTIPPPPPTTTPAPTTTTAAPCPGQEQCPNSTLCCPTGTCARSGNRAICCTGTVCGLECCDDGYFSEYQCCDGECCAAGHTCLTTVFAEGPHVEEEVCCPSHLTCDDRCCDGSCYSGEFGAIGIWFNAHPLIIADLECCPAGGTVCEIDPYLEYQCCEGQTPKCCPFAAEIGGACRAADACCDAGDCAAEHPGTDPACWTCDDGTCVPVENNVACGMSGEICCDQVCCEAGEICAAAGPGDSICATTTTTTTTSTTTSTTTTTPAPPTTSTTTTTPAPPTTSTTTTTTAAPPTTTSTTTSTTQAPVTTTSTTTSTTTTPGEPCTTCTACQICDPQHPNADADGCVPNTEICGACGFCIETGVEPGYQCQRDWTFDLELCPRCYTCGQINPGPTEPFGCGVEDVGNCHGFCWRCQPDGELLSCEPDDSVCGNCEFCGNGVDQPRECTALDHGDPCNINTGLCCDNGEGGLDCQIDADVCTVVTTTTPQPTTTTQMCQQVGGPCSVGGAQDVCCNNLVCDFDGGIGTCEPRCGQPGAPDRCYCDGSLDDGTPFACTSTDRPCCLRAGGASVCVHVSGASGCACAGGPQHNNPTCEALDDLLGDFGDVHCCPNVFSPTGHSCVSVPCVTTTSTTPQPTTTTQMCQQVGGPCVGHGTQDVCCDNLVCDFDGGIGTCEPRCGQPGAPESCHCDGSLGDGTPFACTSSASPCCSRSGTQSVCSGAFSAAGCYCTGQQDDNPTCEGLDVLFGTSGNDHCCPNNFSLTGLTCSSLPCLGTIAGTENTGASTTPEGLPADGTCHPQSCAELGCGLHQQCGGTIGCGPCVTTPETCLPRDVCNAGECGEVSDGCGGTIVCNDCPTTPSPDGTTPTPVTCADHGGACSADGDCCEGLYCRAGACRLRRR